jgi:hypothetical protein
MTFNNKTQVHVDIGRVGIREGIELECHKSLY